jgi:hypothetical protein
MLRAGFGSATPATKRPQTYPLDRAATGIGEYMDMTPSNVKFKWLENITGFYSLVIIIYLRNQTLKAFTVRFQVGFQ